MPRPLKEIAKDVRSNWISIPPEAEPFLAAMDRLDHIRADGNADVKVLAQFRWAARKWGGPAAGRIKGEIDLILNAY
jgi:DNA topoisomerase IB